MHYARLASRSLMLVATLTALRPACSSGDDASGAPSGSVGEPTAGNHSGGRGAADGIAGAPASEGGAAGKNEAPGGSPGMEEAAGGASSDQIPDFNGCTTADYVDGRASGASRTIDVGGMGLVFTPKCLTVAAGQTVRWAGSFSAHPLAPGNPAHADAGSPDNPILITSSGNSVDFAFANAGTYPYHCQLHSFGDGMGMAGVVHVTP